METLEQLAPLSLSKYTQKESCHHIINCIAKLNVALGKEPRKPDKEGDKSLHSLEPLSATSLQLCPSPLEPEYFLHI